MDREQIASDAVARLLDTQMPWGEWGAIGESPEARYAQRMRAEYRYSPIPKANVFRTVLAIDCLSKVEPCEAVISAIQRASAWLRNRLLGSTHPQAPEGGFWTAHIAIPAGIGLGLEIPDLVCTIDLRHTAQAWSSLLWRGEVAEKVVRDKLTLAAYRIAKAAERDGLWGNIQGSEKPNNFASACCVSFLHCALPGQTGECLDAVARALKRADKSLPEKIRKALQLEIEALPAEEAGRSLWIVARSGRKIPFESLRDSLDRRLGELISTIDVSRFRAGIRLAAAARAFGWEVQDDWIIEKYKSFSDELHPPDLAFVVLAMGNPSISRVEELRKTDALQHRTWILQGALQERLEVLEWLEANRELSAEQLKKEQKTYIRSLVAENDLSEWRSIEGTIEKREWESVRSKIDELASRRSDDKDASSEAGANREIRAVLEEIPNDEIRKAFSRILPACHRVRVYHKKKRFPRDVLTCEEHVRHFLGLEFDALGFHTDGYEAQDSAGRIDFLLGEPEAKNQEMMICECKYVDKKSKLDSLRKSALDQVARYHRDGRPYRIVFMCCAFEEDSTEVEDSFHHEVRHQGEIQIEIVWMNIYFWIKPATDSTTRKS